jgi:hypothetical protein
VEAKIKPYVEPAAYHRPRRGDELPCGLEVGQKVSTPKGSGKITSQQGDRLIVKFPNLLRLAFPISEVS